MAPVFLILKKNYNLGENISVNQHLKRYAKPFFTFKNLLKTYCLKPTDNDYNFSYL